MKKLQKPPHLQLHKLIVAMSYWGATVRSMLLGFMLLVALGLGFVSGVAWTDYAGRFIYTAGFYLLLDAGYVTVARLFPLKEVGDTFFMLSVLLAVGIAIVLPYFMVGLWGDRLLVWLPAAVVIVLALRTGVGLLANNHRR